MIFHDLIDKSIHPPPHRYNLVFSEETCKVISLSALAFFDANAGRGCIIMPKEIIANESAPVVAESKAQPWDAYDPQPTQFLSGPDGFYQW